MGQWRPQVLRVPATIGHYLIRVVAHRPPNDQGDVVSTLDQSLGNLIDVDLRSARERMFYIAPAVNDDAHQRESLLSMGGREQLEVCDRSTSRAMAIL